MPDASTIAVFMVAAGALLIVPGPAVLYIVARGIDQGRRAALVSALVVVVVAILEGSFAAMGADLWTVCKRQAARLKRRSRTNEPPARSRCSAGCGSSHMRRERR